MSKRNLPWTLIALAIVIIVTIIAVTYGEGQLNIGAFNLAALKNMKKVSRVASAVCPQNTEKGQGDRCAFPIDMGLEYYVIKDGDNFTIWGPSINKIVTDNNFSFPEGSIVNGTAYNRATLTRTPLTLTFKTIVKSGKQVPSFSLDYATATLIKGSSIIEIEIPNTSLNIGLGSFNLPDKNLMHT